MIKKPVPLFATVVLGAALLVCPNLVGGTGLTTYGQAFAKNGGNSANAHSQSPGATKNAEKTANANGASASDLGALNAAHASAKAFANAGSNSRVGKIKAYYLASEAAALTDAAALQAAFEGSAPPAVVTAYLALKADPGNVTLQAAYAQAVSDAGLLPAQVIAFETAYTDWQNAVEADNQAATALNIAANKTPVSDETLIALDALVADKLY